MSATNSIPTPVQFAVIASYTAPGDHQIDWGSQANGGRDLATQLVISVTLGLSAFFSFCVCIRLARAICVTTNVVLASPAKMDRAVCCTEKTTECGLLPT